MGTDTLVFEKRGYSTEEFTNFGRAGIEMGGEANELKRGTRIHKHDATHKLMKKDGGTKDRKARTELRRPSPRD